MARSSETISNGTEFYLGRQTFVVSGPGEKPGTWKAKLKHENIGCFKRRPQFIREFDEEFILRHTKNGLRREQKTDRIARSVSSTHGRRASETRLFDKNHLFRRGDHRVSALAGA